MANDRSRTDDVEGPGGARRQGDLDEEGVRGGTRDDVRSIADEEDEEFEDEEDVEGEEEDEGSF